MKYHSLIILLLLLSGGAVTAQQGTAEKGFRQKIVSCTGERIGVAFNEPSDTGMYRATVHLEKSGQEVKFQAYDKVLVSGDESRIFTYGNVYQSHSNYYSNLTVIKANTGQEVKDMGTMTAFPSVFQADEKNGLLIFGHVNVGKGPAPLTLSKIDAEGKVSTIYADFENEHPFKIISLGDHLIGLVSLKQFHGVVMFRVVTENGHLLFTNEAHTEIRAVGQNKYGEIIVLTDWQCCVYSRSGVEKRCETLRFTPYGNYPMQIDRESGAVAVFSKDKKGSYYIEVLRSRSANSIHNLEIPENQQLPGDEKLIRCAANQFEFIPTNKKMSTEK